MTPEPLSDAKRVLVLGGTGHTGRVVVRRLAEAGLSARVLTRDEGRARQVLEADVEVSTGDLTDVTAVTAALRGIDAVVLTHGAPFGSEEYEAVDYGAVPTTLEALHGRSVRVVLMSSIGVTGQGGAYRDLGDWKRRGERILRVSGLPYTIVRPGWFDDEPDIGRRIDLRQGDRVERGAVLREHLADTLVHALTSDVAIGRTFEVFSVGGPPLTDWAGAFAALDPDAPGSLDGAHDRPGLDLDTEPERVRADLSRLRRSWPPEVAN